MAKIPSRDHYFRKAKAENYPARSVYKLKEIDERLGLLKPGFRVLDLGASPGSWSQYAAERIGPQGRILAVDLKPPARPLDNVTWVQGDVRELSAETLVGPDGAFDLVLSDMAPNTTGQKDVDAARSLELAETAFTLAARVLKPQGRVLVKIFMGQDFKALLDRIKVKFKTSRVIKPAASLKQSRETYILATGPAD